MTDQDEGPMPTTEELVEAAESMIRRMRETHPRSGMVMAMVSEETVTAFNLWCTDAETVVGIATILEACHSEGTDLLRRICAHLLAECGLFVSDVEVGRSSPH